MKFSKGQLITAGVAAAGVIANKVLKGLDTTSSDPISQNTQYLWKFVEHDSIYSKESTDAASRKHGYGPAPDVVGVNQSGGPGTIDHVDVVNNFPWTQSPKTARWDVPTMLLREKKIDVNPQLNQIAQNLFIAGEKGARAADMIYEKTPAELKEMIKNQQVTPENEIGQKIIAGFKAVGEAASDMTSSSGVLGAYEGLYWTTDTGFVYSLPYLQENAKSVTSSYSSSAGKGLVGLAQDITGTARDLATAFNIADPGTYIEQPKMFNFTDREKSYTLEFPLINTNSFNDVIKNWQLIFLLAYQNSPNRLTRDLVDPPCIYEANLDGTWYSKYAYISNLTVGFQGATRRMTLPIPSEVTADGSGDKSAQNFNVETIIPDVYKVSITVNEIFGETQNMLFHSVNQQNRLVTTQRATIETSGPSDAVRRGIDAISTI